MYCSRGEGLPGFTRKNEAGQWQGFGASANVVAAGICASHGKRISFVTFMRYGVPLTVCQLLVSALHVLALCYFVGG